MHEQGAVPAPVHIPWAPIIIPKMCYVVLYYVRREVELSSDVHAAIQSHRRRGKYDTVRAIFIGQWT